MNVGFLNHILLIFLIRLKTGEESYMIPNGGASMLGKWGYFDAFDEILKQVTYITAPLILGVL